MSATGRRVEFLARAIVNRLEDRGLVEFLDAEAGILVVTKAIEENFAASRRPRAGSAAAASASAPPNAQVEAEMARIAVERNHPEMRCFRDDRLTL